MNLKDGQVVWTKWHTDRVFLGRETDFEEEKKEEISFKREVRQKRPEDELYGLVPKETVIDLSKAEITRQQLARLIQTLETSSLETLDQEIKKLSGEWSDWIHIGIFDKDRGNFISLTDQDFWGIKSLREILKTVEDYFRDKALFRRSLQKIVGSLERRFITVNEEDKNLIEQLKKALEKLLE